MAASVIAMRVSDLVEDLTVYPRAQVDTQHVTHLAAALEAGNTLPPLIADRKSNRLVDGFHRRRAHLQVFGIDALVDVELRRYKTEAELLTDAVTLNTNHGRNLTKVEQLRNTLRLQDMGVDDRVIAVALHTTPARVQTLRLRVATVIDGDGNEHQEALKRSTLHFAGRTMTADQVKAQATAPGVSYTFLIRQLQEALEFGLINGADGRVIVALTGLEALLVRYLAEQGAVVS